MRLLLPAGGNRVLTDLATQLWAESTAFNSNLQVATILGIGDLVRTMNCYYSNLIEGHRTHPIDIERALAQDFSIDPQQRELSTALLPALQLVIDWKDCLRSIE